MCEAFLTKILIFNFKCFKSQKEKKKKRKRKEENIYMLQPLYIQGQKKNFTRVAIQIQAFRRKPKRLRLFSHNNKA